MTYDPDLIDRLVREAREDDATIPRCWEVEHDRNDQPNIYAVDLHAGDRYWVAILPHQCVKSIEDEQNATAVALVRVRDNLRLMADQLEAARREVERLARLQSTTVRIAMEEAGASGERRVNLQQANLALLAERDLMAPVVAAVERWRNVCDPNSWSREAENLSDEGEAVLDAIDAYRAAKGKT